MGAFKTVGLWSQAVAPFEANIHSNLLGSVKLSGKAWDRLNLRDWDWWLTKSPAAAGLAPAHVCGLSMWCTSAAIRELIFFFLTSRYHQYRHSFFSTILLNFFVGSVVQTIQNDFFGTESRLLPWHCFKKKNCTSGKYMQEKNSTTVTSGRQEKPMKKIDTDHGSSKGEPCSSVYNRMLHV